jgi:hypothetical protein
MNKKEKNKKTKNHSKTMLKSLHKDLQVVYSYYILIINQDLKFPIID